MKVTDYRQLTVWQKGIEIVDKMYALTGKFPREELYGLTVRRRKAAVSIPPNMAEGFVRGHSGEYRHFRYIALGSCAELGTQAIITHRRKSVTDNDVNELAEGLDHEARMLTNLMCRIDAGASDERRGISEELC
jgi:four helix bundle protein